MPRIDRLSPAAANGLTAAGRQLKVWWSAGWDNSETPPGLYSRLSLFSFGVFCLNFLFLLYFYIVAGYNRASDDIGENHPLELLQAGLWGAGGLALFLAVAAAGPGLRRWVYILVGLGFLFVAGEELSWGQHILGFATPDFLRGINYHQETNIHNTHIAVALFSVLYTLVYLVTITAFLSRKYSLSVLPLPSLWLAFFLALIGEFGHRFSLLDFFELRSPLFLILAIFLGMALLARDKRLLALVLTITALSVSMLYLDYNDPSHYPLGYSELKEYLISLAAFLYSLQLLRDGGGERWPAWGRRIKSAWFRPKGRAAELSPPPPRLYEGFQRPGRGWEYHSWRWIWPAACLLAVSGSIGLIVLHWQLSAARDREHQALFAQPPTIQSHSWNIWLLPEWLVYMKDADCRQVEEADYRFFLHIIPIHENDLPRTTRARGLHNLSFRYNRRIESLRYADGRCLAVADLPDYPIAQIYTGQLVEEPGPAGPAGDNAESDSHWRQLWEVQLDLDADYYRAAYQPIAAGRAGPPLERGVFDLYRYDNALYYFKESCAPADVADRFLLHIVPIRLDYLPAERQPFRFSNLDFDFNRRGHWFDGKCLAIVPLPDYPIAEIRTGQQVDGMPVWTTRVNLAAEHYRDAYQSIATGQAGEPAARAVFDLYRQDNALYYFKESCAAVDTDARFFLHLIPENPENLPAAERALGFANQDFDFDRRGQRFDGKCVAVAELPDYPIAEIRTGQFGADGTVWEVVLPAGN